MPGRREAEDQARDQRDRQGEHQRRHIDRHFAESRQIRGRQRKQRRHSPARDDHAASSREQGKHHALSEHLPDQPHAAGADRRAHHQLASARRRAREQQVRDIGARNQQHERHRGEQHQQRLPRIADHDLLHRHNRDALLAVTERVLLAESRCDPRHLGLRLRHRHARRQSADAAVIVRGARLAFGRHRIGIVDVGAFRIAHRRDADDRARALAERDRRANRPRIRSELPAPVRFGDDDRIRVARFLFFGREQPSDPRGRAKHTEISRRHARDRGVVRDVVDRHAGLAAAGVVGERRETLVLRAPVEEVRP